MRKKGKTGQIVLNMIFIAIAIAYIAPLMLVISASFTEEKVLAMSGFSLLPRAFSLEAYEAVFRNPAQLLWSYGTTIVYSVIGTGLSVLVMALMAYPLARSNFKLRKIINFYVLFTMLFNGGLVPSYLIYTRYLHLDDTIWIYILPGVVTAYNLFVMKAGYISIPTELIEAGKVDGASEFYICFRIMMPLAKATMATVAFLILVSKWNEWYTASIYIENPKLYSLQYLLQKILNEAQFLKQLSNEAGIVANVQDAVPLENLKYAMAVVAAGPMLVAFPFFQKYFVKGMTIGAVKG